jgi:hypothetical protein
VTRIPIKYAQPFTAILTGVGAPPGTAYVEVDDTAVRVRLGWAFGAKFPRASIQSIDESPAVISVGAHGWRGRWLVNGARAPIARILLNHEERARVLGVRVKLRELLISVDDVAELKRQLIG